MKKICFIAITALLLFTACSNHEEEINIAEGKDLIQLSSNIDDGGLGTRANLSDAETQNTQFASAMGINVEIYKTGASSSYTSGTYTANGSGGLTGYCYYPADGSNIDICAYYPKIVSSSTTSFNVGTSQTSAANYQDYDLMYAIKLTNKAKGSTHELSFRHALAKIVVNLSAGNGVSDSDLTSYVTAVKLKSLKPTATFSISGGAVGSITATGTAADVSIKGSTVTSSHNAIIVPQAKSGAFIEVTYNGNTYTYSLPSSTTFSPGYVYTYNISVNSAGISLSTTSITGWTSTTAVSSSITL